MMRVPPKLVELISGTPEEAVDAHSIQPYYTVLLAEEAGMAIDVVSTGEAIVFTARVVAPETVSA